MSNAIKNYFVAFNGLLLSPRTAILKSNIILPISNLFCIRNAVEMLNVPIELLKITFIQFGKHWTHTHTRQLSPSILLCSSSDKIYMYCDIKIRGKIVFSIRWAGVLWIPFHVGVKIPINIHIQWTENDIYSNRFAMRSVRMQFRLVVNFYDWQSK